MISRSVPTVFASLLLACAAACSFAAEPVQVVAPPALDNPKLAGKTETAVFAGGCFWGIQGVFEHVRGVREVLAGYAGGSRQSAQYEVVSGGGTGHAESVQIVFDPAQVSYGELLQVFFSVGHDPTQLNHQGPDTGTQYRSDVFYADASQKRIAESYIAQLNAAKAFTRPIVTRVDALTGFYPAEGYHQDFYLKNPDQPYIVINDLPKIRNLERLFPDRYRPAPVTVAAR